MHFSLALGKIVSCQIAIAGACNCVLISKKCLCMKCQQSGKKEESVERECLDILQQMSCHHVRHITCNPAMRAVAMYSAFGIICSGAVSVRADKVRKPNGLLAPYMASSKKVIISGQPPVAL